MNADTLAKNYTKLINDSIRDKPADMTITTHVCRGNFRSTWISSGGYEPIAETMLAGCNYDGYFLEYDSDRAGGFEPLRFLPKGNKIVVVGVITSKSGTLEPKDVVKRRIDEAAKFAPLEQLALRTEDVSLKVVYTGDKLMNGHGPMVAEEMEMTNATRQQD